MSKRSLLLYLEDIVTSIERIGKYTEGMSFDSLEQNQMAIDAVVKNFVKITVIFHGLI